MPPYWHRPPDLLHRLQCDQLVFLVKHVVRRRDSRRHLRHTPVWHKYGMSADNLAPFQQVP